MQSGELIVTGKDSAQIILRGIPAKVHVHFAHELEVVPCNPHHKDSLSWEVDTSHPSRCALNIEWSVTGVREIKWTVLY